jgi:predicted ATPase
MDPATEATTASWRLVQDGFDRAVALAVGTARENFLAALAADAPRIAEQVRTLLDAEAQASAFLGEVADEARRFDAYTLQPGQQIGHYRIVECLAAGGMGVVYRAHDTRLQRDVALKFLHPACADDPDQRQRFFQEARAASRLDHEHICTVHEIGETDGRQVYIVMALCPGADLAQMLRQRALRLEEILSCGVQLADALAAAHAQGVIHRDLKPANAIVDASGRLRLVDFGIAVVARQLATSDRPVGTIAYMAPEQFGAGPIDPRCDLWAIGVTLYEALTGRRPFSGADTAALTRAILHDDPAPPGTLVPGVPRALDDIVIRCLRKVPAERFPSAEALRDALREVQRSIAGDPLATVAPARAAAIANPRHAPQPPRNPDGASYVTVLAARGGGTEAGWHDAVARFGGRGVAATPDCRFAAFGFPLADEFATQRALRCGLSLANDGLAVAIGAGPIWIVAGDQTEPILGGDVFDECRRLAGQAKAGELRLLASSYQRLRDFVRAEPLVSGGAYRVTGKSSARGALDAFTPERLTPFVGRVHELGLLQEAWTRCVESDHPPILIAGEAGIGKSRLVYEFKQWIDRDGSAFTLECLCSPHQTASPLQPISNALSRAIFGANAERPPAQPWAQLEYFFASHDISEPEHFFALTRLLGVADSPSDREVSLTPEALKEKTLEALLRLIRARIKREPGLVIVEDLHWADPTTLEFLQRLRDAAAAQPLLIVGTHRPEFKSAWTNTAEISRIGLARLRQSQAEQLLDAVLRGRELDANRRAAALDKSEGNPLFIEEMAEALMESGAPVGDVPGTLRDALLARLDRIGDAKSLAQTAAMLGREFDVALLDASHGSERGQTERALRALVASSLVQRLGESPQASYRFKHALIRDAAYESLDPAERRARHGRAARALVERFPERGERQPELAAYHFQQAGESAPAVDYWSRAAEAALGRFAILEAAQHARAGLEALQVLESSAATLQAELRLQTTLGPALMAAKGYADPEVSAVYSRARELCDVLGNPPAVFPVLFGLWTFHCVRALHPQALQLAEQLVALADAADSAELRTEAHMVRGITKYFQGDFRAAERDFETAWKNYAPDDFRAHILRYGQDPGMVIRSYQSWNAWMLGNVAAADRASVEALQLARRTQHPFSIAYGLTFAAWHALNRGRAAQAAELLAEAIALCREQKLQVFLALALALDALRRIGAGELAAGFAAMQEALAVFTATGAELFLPAWQGVMAQAIFAQGDAAQARQLLLDAIARSERTEERWCLPELKRARALLAAATGDVDAARAALAQAAELARTQGAAPWLARIADTQAQLAQAAR